MAKIPQVFAFAVALNPPKVGRFATKREALSNDMRFYLPSSMGDLEAQTILAPTEGLLAIVNGLTGTTYQAKTIERKSLCKLAFEAAQNFVPINTVYTAGDENMEDQTTGTVNGETIPDNVSQQMAEAQAAERAKQEEAAKAKAAKEAEVAKAKEAKAAEKAKKAAEKAAAAKTKEEEKAKAKAEKEAAAAKAKADKEAAKKDASGSSGAGRVSVLAGKILKPSEKIKNAEGIFVNPRRAGTTAGGTMDIIVKNPNGITTEDVVKAGGRMKDIHWDIDHGYIDVVAPAAKQEEAPAK